MRAEEIAGTFEQIAPIELGHQADRDQRRLGFRYGDPTIDVTGVGVAWDLTKNVIEQAIQNGLNMLLIHEPEPFIAESSKWYSTFLTGTHPVNLARQRLLLENDICVYTAHSNWDSQPDVGMQPTLAKALGLSDEIKRDGAVGIYRIAAMSFGELATEVKARLRLGHLRYQGNREQAVSTVALGFGSMGMGVDAILANGADAGIFGELREKSFIFAREAGVGIIEIGHLVSESIGFRSVVDAMKQKLPDLKITFLEMPYPYEWL